MRLALERDEVPKQVLRPVHPIQEADVGPSWKMRAQVYVGKEIVGRHLVKEGSPPALPGMLLNQEFWIDTDGIAGESVQRFTGVRSDLEVGARRQVSVAQ